MLRARWYLGRPAQAGHVVGSMAIDPNPSQTRPRKARPAGRPPGRRPTR